MIIKWVIFDRKCPFSFQQIDRKSGFIRKGVSISEEVSISENAPKTTDFDLKCTQNNRLNSFLPQNAFVSYNHDFFCGLNFDILDKTWTIIRSDTNEELSENERWTCPIWRL